MAAKVRAVHCLNQYFAGLGGEESADIPPRWRDGPQGPGKLVEAMAPDIEIVATIAVGDNYRADEPDAAAAEIADMIEKHIGADGMDILLAGPAFNAGRYGMRCAALCRETERGLAVPAVTALYPENPAVIVYRRDVTIVRAAADVMGMHDAVSAMIAVARKRIAGEALSPESDGVIARGIRENHFVEQTGAERAIDMLMRKLTAEIPATEYPMPHFDRVTPAPALADASQATIALVTSGGIVPRGNPDRIESASASRYGEYSLKGVAALSPETHQSVHGGYDPTYANADPNRVLPVDAMRDLEGNGRIGRLLETYYATVGNATSVERAAGFGADIAAKLVNVGAQAVILTST